MEIKIKTQRSIWDIIWDALRFQINQIKYGDFVHFLPKNADGKSIQKGSVLLGRFETTEGIITTGFHFVVEVKEGSAIVKPEISTQEKI